VSEDQTVETFTLQWQINPLYTGLTLATLAAFSAHAAVKLLTVLLSPDGCITGENN